MKNTFPNGVWPVMLTPFTDDNKVDYNALGKLVEWYFENGCDGLFAVCQSSEMFYLSLEERCEIAAFVKKAAAGRPVIASGHISDNISDQQEELKRMADTGIDALIMISNRTAGEQEDDQKFIEGMDRLIEVLPKTLPLGLYECPYPYKRVLSDEVTKYCADSGRFHFLKDTSCTMKSMSRKLEIMKGSEMKLYNANTATLLESLKAGAAGYSGVMANFHPQLYHWLCTNYKKHPQEARKVSDFLTMCSLIENSNYPVNAKLALQKMGLQNTLMSRKLDPSCLTDAQRCEVDQILEISDYVSGLLKKL